MHIIQYCGWGIDGCSIKKIKQVFMKVVMAGLDKKVPKTPLP